jgi:hypothetical protein
MQDYTRKIIFLALSFALCLLSLGGLPKKEEKKNQKKKRRKYENCNQGPYPLSKSKLLQMAANKDNANSFKIPFESLTKKEHDSINFILI